ncbi:MAG: class I SAM-dependent methyltransferase [Anaerolineales bacterium]|nr:class I SAM-dependent methyltransferase [Anaerolineales bacterium]
MLSRFRSFLEHPYTAGMDIDDPILTERRREIIGEKVFLQRIYGDWYSRITAALPGGNHPVLEIGSGASPGKSYLPDLITSDLSAYPWVSLAADAEHLPFRESSLQAIVMNNVLHHLPHPQVFFDEADRCVIPGGVIAMIEPWNTAWSRFVYTHLHHEPFNPEAESWCLQSSGPLSAANGALPWILFERDFDRFSALNPAWQLVTLEAFMPVRYLLSGGVSLRNLAPAWSHSFWAGMERLLKPLHPRLGMFAFVALKKDV